MKARASEADVGMMRRCLELARRGAGKVSPNPMVGCVIVAPDGELVAEGYHRRLGADHAEADALKKVGYRAPGCTMYVNLEPCRHRSARRTQPCAPRVLDAGITRLVIGMRDPIRSHGGGASWLARRGVEVLRGVLRAECAELNRFFVTWALERRPHVTLKAAITLDGRVATHRGESQWITGPKARKDGHRLRATVDAILVGVTTARADDPRLTTRGVRGRDPIRLVLDSKLRTPSAAKLLPANSQSDARVIIATTHGASTARQTRLEARGAEVWRLGRGKRVHLGQLLTRLGAQEVSSLLVEGGGRVHRSFLDAGLADEIRLYLAPTALGGEVGATGPGWLRGPGIGSLARAPEMQFIGEPVRLGDDLRLILRPRRP